MTSPKAAAIYMVKAASMYAVANDADTYYGGKPAQAFLEGIRDDVAEWLDHLDADQFGDIMECLTYPGTDHEIADGAVPIYTSDVFELLYDTRAYQEDISDFGQPEDLEQAAKWALYEVARRVVEQLVVIAQEAADEAEEENESHDDDPSLGDLPTYTA